MCKNCSILKAAFQSASDDPMNYSPILELVKMMGMQKRLELYAGDCLLSEVHDFLDKEEHYTIKHYMYRVRSNLLLWDLHPGSASL